MQSDEIEYEEAVSRGIKFLDIHYAQWWSVNEDEIDISCCQDCILTRSAQGKDPGVVYFDDILHKHGIDGKEEK